jgi:hypothetical protein
MSLSNLQIAGYNVLGGVSPSVHTGSTFFVSSGKGSDSNDGSKEAPFATIDKALGACTASNDDVIYVMAGHAESVAAAGGIAFDKAGVTVIGLGKGSLRPTITVGTATSATCTVTAANVTIENFIFVGNLDNVATCFTISAKDCTIKNCEFRDVASNKHFLSCILTDAVANSCDGLSVIGCKRFGLAAANTAFISILEGNDRVTLVGNDVVDAAATGDVGHFLILADKNITNAKIAYNTLILPAGSAISVGIFMTGSGTSQTGVVHNNYVHTIDTTAALFCTATLTFGLFENYQSGLVNGSGLLWPAADTPS